MAYDAAKPADNGLIAQGPAEIRENFRALKNDQLVDALKIKGWCVEYAYGSVAGPAWVRVATIAGDNVNGSGILKINVHGASLGSPRAELLISFGTGGVKDGSDGIGGANAVVLGHSRSSAASVVTSLRVMTSTDTHTAYLDLYVSETCEFFVSGFACEYVTLPTPAVATTPTSPSSGSVALNYTNTNHGSTGYSSDSSWICPPGVTTVFVTAAGGGGGGGGISLVGTSWAGGGGGGGGASCLKYPLSVTPGHPYYIYPGAAGAGVSGANGTAGGATEIKLAGTSILTAGGGAGGEVGVNGGIASSGGGGTWAATGVGLFAGSSGGPGIPTRGGDGGGSCIGCGGNGAGSHNDGVTPTALIGNDATHPGGGGGGASGYQPSGSADAAGGNGALGFVLLEW